MGDIKVILAQLNSIRGPSINLEMMEKILRGEFDIAIFPELYYSGYLLRDNIRLKYIDEELIDRIKSLVGNRMLIFGAPFKDGYLRNSALLISDNMIEIYHKMHLPTFGPFEEIRFFKEGGSPLVVTYKGLKINIQICYDIFFTDSIIKGSDIIVNISASPFTSRPHFEKVIPSIALLNQSFFIYVNTSGLQRNLVFWGGSRVVDPEGMEMVKLPYFRDEVREIELDVDKIRISRIKRPLLKEAT